MASAALVAATEACGHVEPRTNSTAPTAEPKASGASAPVLTSLVTMAPTTTPATSAARAVSPPASNMASNMLPLKHVPPLRWTTEPAFMPAIRADSAGYAPVSVMAAAAVAALVGGGTARGHH